MSSVRRSIVIVAALVSVLAACSGGDDDRASPSSAGSTSSSAPRAATGSAADYSDAIASALRAAPGFESVSASDAQCAADGAVEAIGLDVLHGVGVSPTEIRRDGRFPEIEGKVTDAQATALADALVRCIDFGRVVADQIAGLAKLPDVRLSAKQLQCLNTKIEGNPEVRKAIANAYTGRTAAGGKDEPDILALAAQCIPLRGALSTTTTTP